MSGILELPAGTVVITSVAERRWLVEGLGLLITTRQQQGLAMPVEVHELLQVLRRSSEVHSVQVPVQTLSWEQAEAAGWVTSGTGSVLAGVSVSMLSRLARLGRLRFASKGWARLYDPDELAAYAASRGRTAAA